MNPIPDTYQQLPKCRRQILLALVTVFPHFFEAHWRTVSEPENKSDYSYVVGKKTGYRGGGVSSRGVWLRCIRTSNIPSIVYQLYQRKKHNMP